MKVPGGNWEVVKLSPFGPEREKASRRKVMFLSGEKREKLPGGKEARFFSGRKQASRWEVIKYPGGKEASFLIRIGREQLYRQGGSLPLDVSRSKIVTTY